MEFLRPTSWDDALAAKAEHPDALPIRGGTDVMVELNFDVKRPEVLLDLGGVKELGEWSPANGSIQLGAGVSYTRIIAELGDRLPGLALASRTVGSPQIRNRGTVGGNLGSASPAGDAHPPLLASSATVVAESVRGRREIGIDDFFIGVKRSSLAPDELIHSVLIDAATGPQQFSKVGTRNAMVIAVCAFALALHPKAKAVGTGIGSAAPTPVRAPEADAFLAHELPWDSRGELPETVALEFGRLVAGAASPIDDVRGTAAYRRHALSVLARRTLGWAWRDYQTGGWS
jgi:CO/xanthine dehydrogenase FAD-binding subunit